MRFLFVFMFIAVFSVFLFASPNMQTADSLFQLRNKKFDTENLLADTTYINQAISQYKAILEQTPSDSVKHEALWKLLQAFYFKGQFGSKTSSVRKHVYDQGIKLGESYLNKYPNSKELNAWLGIMWARWAEESGIIAAARKGVASKVKKYAEKSIELDSTYLGAGGYRLLGMLNVSVPKIPLFLSWPSKERGLQYLEKAHELAPQNLYNKMYLAEVLYDMGQKERAKALCLDIVNQKEIVHDLAIDAYIKQKAQTFLDEHF